MASFDGRALSGVKLELINWAYCNGLVMRTTAVSASASADDDDVEEYAKRLVSHAPFDLEPYSFPQTIFEEACSLAPLFNSLVHKVARNESWLLDSLKSTGESDDGFTGRLMGILKQTQLASKKQSCYFGIHRSDYMLHEALDGGITFLQVELNTIASSFGSLSSKVASMHRAMYGNKFNVPPNEALEKIGRSMQCAHHEYVNQTGSFDSIVLIVVQDKERNFADQRHFQDELLEKYMISSERATLADISKMGDFSSESGSFLFCGKEVSVVYFRAGYAPEDYTCEDDWSVRLKMELSQAIKCPNIAYHLAGTKKIQQVLANPGVLEKFMDATDSSRIRKVFAGLYDLSGEDTNCQLEKLMENAILHPETFVMKPQREGGGNNLYGQFLSKALTEMSAVDRSAYILMDRIMAPSREAALVKEGSVVRSPCICELGVYGVFIGYGNDEPILNEQAGYLLRVKPSVSDEGGVAAGFAVLSSPSLYIS